MKTSFIQLRRQNLATLLKVWTVDNVFKLGHNNSSLDETETLTLQSAKHCSRTYSCTNPKSKLSADCCLSARGRNRNITYKCYDNLSMYFHLGLYFYKKKHTHTKQMRRFYIFLQTLEHCDLVPDNILGNYTVISGDTFLRY